MKITVEKSLNQVRIELTPYGARKPVEVVMTTDQLDNLLSLLQLARRSDRFVFSYEVA